MMETIGTRNGVTYWATLDSGKRAEFDSGMVRDTQEGKARFDLLMPEGVPYEHQMLTRFANLMARGAEKYSARNWEKARGVVELARFKASAFRHFMQWFCGCKDEDHAVATWFNMQGVEFVEYMQGTAPTEYVIPASAVDDGLGRLTAMNAMRKVANTNGDCKEDCTEACCEYRRIKGV